MKPIRPDEVASAKVKYLPPEVIKAINDLIIKHWNGKNATIKQNELVDEMCKNFNKRYPEDKYVRQDIFNEKYLEFEDAFRTVGWDVKYDRSDYTETRDSTFIFTKGD